MPDPTDSSEPETVTLAEFARGEWLPSMRGRLKPSTWDSYRRNMELHVLPQLGSSLLTELTPRSLNVLYGGLLEHGKRNGRGGLSATTVRYIHVIIHGALADAADLGLVAANPASRAKPPRVNRPVHESSAWNADELQTFLRSVADDRIYPAIHLAALTGMRRGEILGLQWGDVDLPNSRLVVRHTLVSIGYQVQESTPKTHRPRQVELDEGSSSTLQRHRSATITSGQETGFGDLVFTDDAGERLHPDLFTQRFDRLVARSGLRRIRLHDLRHTHATLALAAGVPVRVMSERLGHASPEFTMRQYQHVLPGMQAAAAQQIADLVSGGAN